MKRISVTTVLEFVSSLITKERKILTQEYELSKSEVTIGLGEIVKTEFGTGTIKAITDDYVIVGVYEEDEVCIDKHSGLFMIPVALTGHTEHKSSLQVVGVGDEVMVDDNLVGRIKIITKDYVIIENHKGESPVFIRDASFYLPYNIEFKEKVEA